MKQINFKIRSSSTCPAKKIAMDNLDSLVADFLPVPIKFELKNDRFTFYFEEIDRTKKIGDMRNDGSSEAGNILCAALNEQANANVYLTGYEGNTFNAVIKYTLIEKEEVKVDASVFDELTNKIISEKIATKEECTESISFMKSHRFPDELIRQCLLSWSAFDTPLKAPETAYIDTEPNSKHASIMARAAIEVLCGHHIIFEGDKSVGKNMAAESLAYFVFRRPFNMITMSRTMCGDDIYGTKSTDNSAAGHITSDMAFASIIVANGRTGQTDEEWHRLSKLAADFEYWSAKAASVQIVQEISSFVETARTGGIFCMNEMNLSDANFLASVVNQATDGSGFIMVPGIGRVDIDSRFTLLGTQNADYTGTVEQNDATISRMACIQFPYPDSIKNQLIAASKVDLNDQYFTQADNLYKSYLKAVKKGNVENSCLNIRGMVRALQSTALIPGLVKLAEEIEMQVINTCPKDDRPDLMAQLKEIVTL